MISRNISTPSLINLPSSPSDPVTPPDMGPGTPNSATTSLSALSTTAIKDGHQGRSHSHNRHGRRSSSASASSTTTLDAERADRISRLAGLERVTTARAGGTQNTAQAATAAAQAHPPGYFDSYVQIKERSTVGSASATSSIGGCTTWASSSDAFEADKKSEELDDGVSSLDGLSDEGNSIVGFGEGASSTASGPVSDGALSRISSAGGRPGLLGSPTTSRTSAAPFYMQHPTGDSTSGRDCERSDC